MDKVDGLREVITLNKTADWEGIPVVRLSATIYSDPVNDMSESVTIAEPEIYAEKTEHFRKEIDDFKAVVRQREDFIIGLYLTKPEEPAEPEPEEVVEESVEDIPAEDIPVEEESPAEPEA